MSSCRIIFALSLLACVPPNPTSTPKTEPQALSASAERHEPKETRMNTAKEGELSEPEASLRATEFLSRRSRSGGLPESLTPLPECTHNCVLPGGDSNSPLCDSWTCNFLFSDRSVPPIAMFSVHITHKEIRAVPDVEACIAKDHECAPLVGRSEAMRRLQADVSELAIVWDDEEGEFFWVNTRSNRRISCHRPAR